MYKKNPSQSYKTFRYNERKNDTESTKMSNKSLVRDMKVCFNENIMKKRRLSLWI